MRKLIVLMLIVFASVITKAQTETPKSVVVITPQQYEQLNENMRRAGIALEQGGTNYYIMLGMYVAGAGVTALGIYQGELGVATGGSILLAAGFAYNIAAWTQVRKAGKILQEPIK